MSSDNDHIKWFRASSPYINTHRGKTFVIHLPGDAIMHYNFANVINDIALLHSLGVRLVLVHGADPQIELHLSQLGLTWPKSKDQHITTPEILGDILSPIGRTRTDLEARLSTGHSPLQGLDTLVTSGNFVRARPLGIVDGTDFHHTGLTRRINTEAIHLQLASDAIVIVSPVGHSPSGETFVLDSHELAQQMASSLGAEKLIFLTPDEGIRDSDGNVLNEIQETQLQDTDIAQSRDQVTLVALTTQACLGGVNRCHILSYALDGALLEELFTRDGSGTQVIRESYEQLRIATSDDVAGIIALIAPLEEQGILVRRSRELIESEIDHFMVIERDRMVVACAALYPFESKGELACLATHPDYRNDSRGELLLQTIETSARNQGLNHLFVLTTSATHWFLERGFVEQSVDVLPDKRMQLYNFQRSSKFLQKSLQE